MAATNSSPNTPGTRRPFRQCRLRNNLSMIEIEQLTTDYNNDSDGSSDDDDDLTLYITTGSDDSGNETDDDTMSEVSEIAGQFSSDESAED